MSEVFGVANSPKSGEVRADAGPTRVVINKCFGGFGLSLAGERAYLARKGLKAFFYVEDRTTDRPGDRDMVRVNDDEAKLAFTTFTSTRDFGERVDHDTFWGADGRTHPWYFYDRDIDRDDPDLVAVVEELDDQASGWAAQLAVVEVPAGVQWAVEEYDGLEHIAEVHRTWA